MSGSGSAASTVVIGAGPYGLATAAHLRARGVRPRVFGDAMVSWREHMPRGMFLKSTPRASSISAPRFRGRLSDFCRAEGAEPIAGHHPIPLETFVRYGTWFGERHAPEVENVRVVGLRRGRTGFIVSLATGEELPARAVVVASGLAGLGHVPAELRVAGAGEPSPDGPVSHSGQHRDLSRYAGMELAIIGAGQSALETAALAHEAGARVRLFVRAPQVWFGQRPENIERQGWGTPLKPESPLGPGWSHVAFARAAGLFRQLPLQARLHFVRTVLGPSGSWWLRERVEGAVPIALGEHVVSVEHHDARVLLTLAGAGGEHGVLVDHVVAATGYRVDLESLPFLDGELRRQIELAGRSPNLRANFESSVPGLYFSGLAAAATFGPLMRFVAGTGFAARRVSAAIAG